MHYKTIVLDMLQDRQELHNLLRSQRMLLPTMERLAGELKASHEAWKQQLSQAKPGSDPSQIASEALELALEELQRHLPPALPPEEMEPLSLEAAMAFITRHTPPA